MAQKDVELRSQQEMTSDNPVVSTLVALILVVSPRNNDQLIGTKIGSAVILSNSLSEFLVEQRA